jgi:hypothetical protein
MDVGRRVPCGSRYQHQSLSFTLMHVQESDGLVEWVRGGGGLVYGGHAWWWVSQNPGKNVYIDNTGGEPLQSL